VLSSVSPARRLALKILLQVAQQDAHANQALTQAFAHESLEERDRALVVSLVYGTLRWQGALDWILAHFSSRSLDRLPIAIRLILRLGAYEILHLERIPSHATVHQYVTLAKRYGHAGTVKLTNALLRRVAESGKDVPFPDVETHPIEHIAAKWSHPRWLVERWVERWGVEETLALCQKNNEPAPVTIRVNSLRARAENVKAAAETKFRTTSVGVQVGEGRWTRETLRLNEGHHVTSLPGFMEGQFTVQDEGSTLVGYVVDSQPGQIVIDACAGPGGKTTHLAEQIQDDGQVMAVELYEPRCHSIRQTIQRLGLNCIRVVQGDFRKVAAQWAEKADVCLVDAPCSGTGVLRRRPDARWRKSLAQIAELTRLQSELLVSAARVVKPGGVLVYSTCSLEAEENEQVVDAFLKAHPHFALEDLRTWLPTALWLSSEPDFTRLQLFPHRHDTDGMFIVRMRRL
jgi:16S rRNA (cytosine967-C5)-methyltransferase